MGSNKMRAHPARILSIAVAALLIFTAHARPQDKTGGLTELGIARSVSIFSVLITKCTANIDAHRAQQYQKFFTLIGEGTWGKAHFRSVFMPEKRRRLKEADVTGPAWCAYQQAYLEKEGIADLFGTNDATSQSPLSSEDLAHITAGAFAVWATERPGSNWMGVIPTIEECYKEFDTSFSQARAALCVSMDYASYTLATRIWQYTHVGLPPYFRKDAFERRVYEAMSRSTPEAARASFLQAIYESIDEDFKHWDEALAH